MKLLFQILFILVITILAFSCKKPQKYPETPSIEFEEFNVVDSVDLLDNKLYYGMLKFSFIDGDGDIGLNNNDTLPPYDTTQVSYHNLFIEMYQFKNSNFEKVDLEVPLYYRINPRVDNSGQNKTIKGSILVKMEYSDYFLSIYDSVKYEFYILDRALHQSNTTESEMVILPEPN